MLLKSPDRVLSKYSDPVEVVFRKTVGTPMMHSVEKRTKPGSLVEIDFFSVKTVKKGSEVRQNEFV